MDLLDYAVVLAGVGQLCLVAGSAFIPKCLNWKDVSENRLMRQLFWTYACYILAMHTFFGVLSTFAPVALTSGDLLGDALLCLMWLWWSVRIVLQFCCFDRSCIPQTRFNGLAEVLLVLLFVYLSTVYGFALWRNILCG